MSDTTMNQVWRAIKMSWSRYVGTGGRKRLVKLCVNPSIFAFVELYVIIGILMSGVFFALWKCFECHWLSAGILSAASALVLYLPVSRIYFWYMTARCQFRIDLENIKQEDWAVEARKKNRERWMRRRKKAFREKKDVV